MRKNPQNPVRWLKASRYNQCLLINHKYLILLTFQRFFGKIVARVFQCLPVLSCRLYPYFLRKEVGQNMYKPIDKFQHSFLDFNQPLGMKMNPENRWIRLADSIPWEELEQKYADLFPSGTGNVAKPLRMALGSLIIQKKFQFSDRELVEQITENPYLQYFIGLPGYQDKPPFDPSTLVLFRKRLDADAIMEANAILFDDRKDDSHILLTLHASYTKVLF